MDSSARRPALVVVDMQEDFCRPHGSLAVDGGRELAQSINELLSYPGFVLKVATRDVHPRDHISFASQHEGATPFKSTYTITSPANDTETQTIPLWPDHCVEGTTGCELISELHQDKLSFIINKGTDRQLESFSGFGPPFRQPKISSSELHEILRNAGVTDLYVVGLSFYYCVKFTALDAAEHGYRAFVIEEATNAQPGPGRDPVACWGEMASHGVQMVSINSDEIGVFQDGQ